MEEAVSTTGISLSRGTGAPAGVAITSSSVADPTLITTGAAHGLSVGDLVLIAGHTSVVPDINGWWKVLTAPTGTTFTIDANVTDGGTGGTAQREVYTKLGRLTETTPPEFTRAKLPTTTHNSGRGTSVRGILDQGDLTGTVNFIGSDATHQQLLQDMLLDNDANWRLDFPVKSGMLIVGRGGLTRFAFAGAPVNGIQQASFTIAWSSALSIFGAEAA